MGTVEISVYLFVIYQAEYVAGNMPQFFDEAFNRNKTKKYDMQSIVKLTLEQCYDDL